ncbi:MAG: alpha-galactosidase [Anaerolineae bacterium]|nr:alpha-galactosidase [Anaerolineae bacterium]
MIHFNPETRTFNLLLKTSFYAFKVDSENRLVHLGWGPRPASADSEAALISGWTVYGPDKGESSFEQQSRPDELVTFGEVSYHEVSLKVNFPSLPPKLQAEEAPHLPIRDVRLRYVDHEIVTDAQPGLSPTHGQPTRNSTRRETLRVQLNDPVQPFQVTLCYRLTPEHDIIERWCELNNLGDKAIEVEVCGFATLNLPHGTNELTAVTGTWAREFTTQRQQLPHNLYILESRTIETSHITNPFFLLNRPGQAWEESGTVYFGQLAYSGNWRLTFEQLPSSAIKIHVGYNPFDFNLTLAPGDRHVTPAIVCGVSANGWGGGSRRMHAFARERVLPRPDRQLSDRPVLYNSWEATYFDLSYDGQLELIRKAAAMGVELFCVDDGWFGGRRHDRAGLGDWVVSSDIFPEGLNPLIEEVHKLGMQFGLWVEPEMINTDSDLYRQHPDWVLHFPGRPRSEARNQLVLDFGRTEVVETIFQALDNLVNEYPIAFFKWDMNRYTSEPGSVAGKALWRKHVEGVYSIMDRLRRNHPNLDIQSCSGGGGRIDLGILGRTDQVWTSDNTDAFDRIRIQEGFSLAYPARAMEAWVTHALNHQTGRISPLSLRFDVAMRGALGIGSSLNELDEAELAEYASYIAFYKRIRHIIQNGDLYRLQRLEEFGASIIQYVLPGGHETVYSVTVHDHQLGWLRPTPPLQGLNPSATYRAVDRHDREVYRASGYELMTLGIPGEAGQLVGYSRTLYLRQI